MHGGFVRNCELCHIDLKDGVELYGEPVACTIYCRKCEFQLYWAFYEQCEKRRVLRELQVERHIASPSPRLHAGCSSLTGCRLLACELGCKVASYRHAARGRLLSTGQKTGAGGSVASCRLLAEDGGRVLRVSRMRLPHIFFADIICAACDSHESLARPSRSYGDSCRPNRHTESSAA